MKVLEVSNLKKIIGKREIIKDISFSIEEGEVYGFLGPNGAGKTTTIRMLVGLIAKTQGNIKICGFDIEKNREKALSNIGAVVENPALYKFLSGRENLVQIARIKKISKEKVDELIKLVGLENRIDDKVKRYSLGMKQRLGIAASLLGEPKLLILDEPTNGLDPSGIIEFRELIKSIAKEKNMAIFVSSHILSEIEQMCDKVAFLKDGVIKSVEQMGQTNESNIDSFILTYRNSNKDKILKILKENNLVKSCEAIDFNIKLKIKTNSQNKILKELIDNNIEIDEIYRDREGLEARYMELVEGGMN